MIKLHFSLKKKSKYLVESKKVCTFALANRGIPVSNIENILIGIWCNGNTTDSGPVILGSSPSIPTKKQTDNGLLFCYSSHLRFPQLFICQSTSIKPLAINKVLIINGINIKT